MISAYINRLNQRVAAAADGAATARQPDLITRVAAIIGDGTPTRIPDLQRALDADPKSLGTALRALGFFRKRQWCGSDYARTQWWRQK